VTREDRQVETFGLPSWAHQADPHALLFYNDYNIAGEDGTNAKSDAVYAG
jgi:GH35 family endo-1,4-beta-xylanase